MGSHASRFLDERTHLRFGNKYEEPINRIKDAAVTLSNNLNGRMTRTEIQKRARACITRGNILEDNFEIKYHHCIVKLSL